MPALSLDPSCRPINLIFRYLQSKQVIQIWLYEQTDLKIEGRIIGFDEYMNLVLDDAHEVSTKRKTRKPLGRILLKGDNISLMQTTGSCKEAGLAPNDHAHNSSGMHEVTSK